MYEAQIWTKQIKVSKNGRSSSCGSVNKSRSSSVSTFLCWGISFFDIYNCSYLGLQEPAGVRSSR